MANNNKMLIDAMHPEETRVVTVHGSRVEEFDFEAANRRQLRGNIYLAKVTRVEPSLQAAFIEYGGNRHGFLAFSEIHPDYYQIPLADRQALLEDEAREAEEHREREERKPRRRSRGRRDGNAAKVAKTSESVTSEAFEDRPEGDPAIGAADALLEGGLATTHETVAHESAAHETNAPESDASADLPQAERADAAPADASPEAEAKPTEDGVLEGATAEKPVAPAAELALEAAPMGDAVAEETPNAEEAEAPATSEDESDADDDSDEDDDDSDDESEEDDDDDSDDEDEDDEEGEGEDGERRQKIAQVGGDAMAEIPERPRAYRRHYKIQEVIKRRQIILVQVVKEERGTKGAALTTYLSLAGRYSVLMPNTGRGGGISRKITSAADRKRLKEVAQDLEVPDGMGVILRTAGASRTKPEIKRDFEYLMRLWESVRELTLSSSAPALVYEEGSLIKRAIRDLYNKDIDDILVAGDEAYREARDFMRMLMPGQSKVVQPYRESTPIFARYGVEQQLDAMFSTHVTLRSGGYLVINPTEALVSIDVNSGRSTREHDIEDTALRTNLEAAEEVARQLRLRDLAGLVVIDFIDMDEKRNNRAVEKKLNECLKNDRARIQVGRISPFGLLEMSRQRIRTGMLESSSLPCTHCGGSGYVRATASVALQILRAIEESLLKSTSHNLILRTKTEVALYILNQKRAHLRELEVRFGVSVTIAADERLAATSAFQLDRGEPASRLEGPVTGVRAVAINSALEPEEDFDPEIEAETEMGEAEADEAEAEGASEEAREKSAEGGEGRGGRRRRRRRRGGRPEGGESSGAEGATSEGEDDGEGEETDEVAAQAEGDEVVAAGETPAAGDDDGSGRRRRRGRRGGRGRDREGRSRDGEGSEGFRDQTSQDRIGQDHIARDETSQDESFGQPVSEDRAPQDKPVGSIDGDQGASDAPSAFLGGEEPVSAEAVAAASTAETPPAQAPAFSEGHVIQAEDLPVAPKPETEAQPAEAPAPAPVRTPAPEPVAVVLTPADPDRPKRAGWWSRTKAALTGE
ncbi:Rne/Rng family ribonuclease [Methylobacterium sp. J-078]|uniref:Rne/Rng family ribonuclease n=1 Tax=Methylobacterium sp. J-078 TaxID=2836657 RepID=UPI001FBA4DD9|nr:ribonuclease E/G [Methylobacterium sp. J-078]MCJ2047572.1 Rne/Rng family ribonuclease [Methylobacterium sp. J-078]